MRNVPQKINLKATPSHAAGFPWPTHRFWAAGAEADTWWRSTGPALGHRNARSGWSAIRRMTDDGVFSCRVNLPVARDSTGIASDLFIREGLEHGFCCDTG